jgi:hypothetical protein
VVASSSATGGAGNGSVYMQGGPGGNASANSTAITTGGNSASSSASAFGGNAGNGPIYNIGGNNGGSASAQATSTAMQGGSANATATATGRNGGVISFTGTPNGIAGVANASSFAATINGYLAQSQSTATGSSGQAAATAQTNFANANTVQTSAVSQVDGSGSANALAQVGSGVLLPSLSNPGQSFSVVSPTAVGPLMVALGSMGAVGIGPSSLNYQQTVNFAFNGNGGTFLVDFLGSSFLGTGFDDALFQLSVNGNLLVNQSFFDLAAAQHYFSTDWIGLSLGTGLNQIELAFSETLSGGQGFSFDFGFAYAGGVAATPLPSTWGMMILGVGLLGFMAYRRRRQPAALCAA